MFDYLVVGAGLFGAVFSHEMKKAGRNCLVIDKRDHIGGNIYTEKIEGIDVHRYGAHIFHTNNREIWDYVNSFCEMNHFINAPIANYKGEIYNLPFNMNTFSRMFGIATPEEAKAIIERERKEITGEPGNLEEQAISLVGRTVYTKLIKGYTEKQWGRDCRELPPFIIRRLPVRFTYDNNYFNDRYQGIPREGYTYLIEKLLEGTEVRLGTAYDEKMSSIAEKIIYTGPIDEYYGFRYGKLEYRTVSFETEIQDTADYQGVAVVNYTDRETPFTRIIEHKHFNWVDTGKTVISREYPSEWREGEEPFYPINNRRNADIYEQYLQMAQNDRKVRFGGRLGSYRYYDMDKTIEEALACVRDELNDNNR